MKALAAGLFLLFCACTIKSQVAGLTTLVTLAQARAVAVRGTMEFDHSKQEVFRQRYALASTLEEIEAIDKDVTPHNQKRDQTYSLLDQLDAAIKVTLKAILERRVHLAAVLDIARKLPDTLRAFGVKDENILGAFSFLGGL